MSPIPPSVSSGPIFKGLAAVIAASQRGRVVSARRANVPFPKPISSAAGADGSCCPGHPGLSGAGRAGGAVALWTTHRPAISRFPSPMTASPTRLLAGAVLLLALAWLPSLDPARAQGFDDRTTGFLTAKTGGLPPTPGAARRSPRPSGSSPRCRRRRAAGRFATSNSPSW